MCLLVWVSAPVFVSVIVPKALTLCAVTHMARQDLIDPSLISTNVREACIRLPAVWLQKAGTGRGDGEMGVGKGSNMCLEKKKLNQNSKANQNLAKH